MVKTVLTEEDRIILKVVALELAEIRKVIDELAETMVELSDKELLKAFDAGNDGYQEQQVERRRIKLESQLDAAEREF